MTFDRRLETRRDAPSRYDVDTNSLIHEFVYLPTPADHGGFVKCLAVQTRRADVGSFVNFFVDRRRGNASDAELVGMLPPMVGQEEVMFESIDVVPVKEVFHRPLFLSGPPPRLELADERDDQIHVEFRVKANPVPTVVEWKEESRKASGCEIA